MYLIKERELRHANTKLKGNFSKIVFSSVVKTVFFLFHQMYMRETNFILMAILRTANSNISGLHL